MALEVKGVARFSVLAIALTAAADAAQAQSAGESARADKSVLEEIVVMARKRAESTADVPLSITAVSGEEFQARGLNSVVDVQRQTPGLFIQQANGSPSAGFLSIRGTQQSDIVMTQDSPVSLYIDNVYMPRQFGLTQSLYDIDHIEVLKGPQGTLYGKNTTGGAINVFTRMPSDEFNGYAQVTAGEHGVGEFQGAVTLPLVSEKLSLRVAGLAGTRDAIERNAIGAKLADNETYSGRAHLSFTPTEDLAITVSADRTRLRDGGARARITGFVPFGDPRNFASTGSPYSLAMLQMLASGVADPEGQYETYLGNGRDNSGIPVKSDYDTKGVSGKISWTLAPVIVQSVTGYRESELDTILDVDKTPFPIFDSIFATDSRFFSQELQVSDDGSGAFRWIAGAYYNRETGDEFTGSVILPALIPPTNIIAGDVKNSSWSLFAQTTFELTAALNLTMGVRWTEETRRLVSTNHDEIAGVPVSCNATGVFPGECVARYKDTFSGESYLASLDYKLNDASLLYAKTSHGFRSGGQNLRGTVSGSLTTFTPFDPEKVTDYELGLKTRLSDRVQLEAAVYYNRITDLQQSVFVVAPSGQASSLVRNVGRAHVWGGELSVTVQPVAALVLNGTLGVVDAEYDRFDDPLFGDRSDEDYPAPKYTYSASAAYTIPVGFGSLTARADYTGQSKVNFFPSAFVAADVTQKSYGLLNGAITAELERFDAEIAVFGTNILDKRYMNGGISLDAKGAPFGYSYGTLGLPRIVGVRLTKQF